MNRRERIDSLLSAFGKEVEALRTEALDEIGRAEREANERKHRYHAAVEELEQVEREIGRLSSERDGLPDRAYRAGLDEEYELEDELKERYKNLRPAIEALEDRQGSLKGEVAELLPQPRGHDLDARIQATTSVARVAFAARSDMEHLQKGLTTALSTAVDPVVEEHAGLLALAEQQGRDREWALSPVGRGAFR